MTCSALFGFIDAIGDTPSRNFDPGWRVKPVSQTIQTVFKIPNSLTFFSPKTLGSIRLGYAFDLQKD
jgi:hypothetical protein